ncbi:MAG: diphthine--ammonia ligase [Candidatus Omnitrophota bacterium]|nr:MAG: diphthine--ammonia ligase [Candidatus Omnitrophota bacterium]
MGKERILFSWSGGKDSSLALQQLQKENNHEIVALLTTVTGGYNRVSMHGVRDSLLIKQAESLGYPLKVVTINQQSSNQEYETRMGEALKEYKDVGVMGVGIGDIFLEDLRRYREERLAQLDLRGFFPLWKKDTQELACDFIAQGFKAVISCVDTRALDAKFVGRQFDKNFLRDIPSSLDPCGENGEFHSFVYDGPIFKNPIKHKAGERVLRENRFCYCHIIETEDA